MPRAWSALLLLALAMVGAPARAGIDPGDAKAGAQAFLPCSACHSVAPGGGALPFSSVEELEAGLAKNAYLADRGLATAVYLALHLDKPLLLEGEAGVGKTEVAKVLAALLGREPVRRPC